MSKTNEKIAEEPRKTGEVRKVKQFQSPSKPKQQ